MNKKCPCHSGLYYSLCCEPFHKGKTASTALQLMRSRYSAYALHLVDYIIATTHQDNPQRIKNTRSWQEAIDQFCGATQFVGLTVLEHKEESNANEANVTFTAHLIQEDKNVSFTEKSYFEKKNGRWYYKNGEVQSHDNTNS